MMANKLALFLLLLALRSSTASGAFSFQLGEMVKYLTNKSVGEYERYGCW
jgi:hypothetical protein